jgi:hypothetical protein
MEKNTLILGPSHINRWIESIRCNVIPTLNNLKLIGRGGSAIWSQFLSQYEKDFDSYEKIVYIVGDFRFGNRSLLDDSLPRNHHGIDKNLINHENDIILFSKCIEKIKSLINSKNGHKIKFIFWDLALREHNNKRLNKFVNNGVYNHPIWNLQDVENIFSENVLSLSTLEENILDKMYIDSSNHPSIWGYKLLHWLVEGHQSENFSINKISPSLFFNQNEIIYAGDSIFVKYVNDFINRGIVKFQNFVNLKQSDLISFAQKNHSKEIIFISSLSCNDDNILFFLKRINSLIRITNMFNSRIKIIFWEAYAKEIIGSRENKYQHLSSNYYLNRHENFKSHFELDSYHPKIDTIDSQGLVELNINLQPTLKGINWILNAPMNRLDYTDLAYKNHINEVFDFSK